MFIDILAFMYQIFIFLFVHFCDFQPKFLLGLYVSVCFEDYQWKLDIKIIVIPVIDGEIFI